MTLTTKLILGVVSLESAALAVLSQDIAVSAQLIEYIALHGAASGLIAYLAWLFLPTTYRQPKRAVLGLFFLFSFLVPFLTVLTIVLIILTMRFFTKPVIYYPFSKITLPKFTLGGAGVRQTLGEGSVHARLNTPSLSPDIRMKALLSANAMSSRYSIPMLKALLGDAADDLRLLAYGMLDNREKTLNALIHAVLKKLRDCSNADLQQLYQKQLAELYWTFAYENLAEGDMLNYMLQQAEHYTRGALAIKPDGDLWIQLAQILARQSLRTESRAAFEQALALGMPVVRIQPYLAELAFLDNDYPRVRAHLKTMREHNEDPQAVNIVSFWLGPQQ
jgi:tetratricopeptide (TPR) repeat protein